MGAGRGGEGGRCLSLSGKGGGGVGCGGRLFEAGRLLTFSAFRMGAYSRWALIRGWALIRINTVCYFPFAKAISLSRFCLCHVLPYYIKRNQRPTSHYVA